MTHQELIAEIRAKKSFLCVGLDTDIQKIPSHLLKEKDPIFTFNRAIIEATHDLCVGYKINTAFYEAQGTKGWESMAKTLEIIPKNNFTIADAKRGDIGNTVHQYAKAFFETLDFDAITVAPYMGLDSVSPFLEYDNKWVILLGLTSNPSSKDFQFLNLDNGQVLFEKVLETAKNWASQERLMFVVGATQTDFIERIRQIIPNHFFLVPGVGSQGGSLEDVSEYGLNEGFGLLINSSRSIIYASSDEDFADKAREEAKNLKGKMEVYFTNF